MTRVTIRICNVAKAAKVIECNAEQHFDCHMLATILRNQEDSVPNPTQFMR